MKCSVSRCLILAMTCVAGAAHAGTVYVPLPGVSTVGNVAYETQVTIVNGGGQQRTVKQLLLTTDTDGTKRDTQQPSNLQVGAGQAMIVKPGSTFRGLLELSGTGDTTFSARLVGTGTTGTLGVQLPVVTSDNIGFSGDTLTLHGLAATSTLATDLTVVNLGHDTAQCTVSVFRTDGVAIGSPATISLKALSHRYFPRMFDSLGTTGVVDARAHVSCTREFYTYGIVSNSANGEVAFAGPAGNGDSALFVPGAPQECPANAQCFDSKGTVFIPTRTDPVGRVSYTPTANTTTNRIRMTMDVTIGNWYPRDPDAKHMIYWFVINRNLDMLGLLFFRGPNDHEILIRHGFGLTHGGKFKIIKSFQGVPGRTYRVENDYDMGRNVYIVRIVDIATGEIKMEALDQPNVRRWTFGQADRLIIDMGLPEGKVPDEVPSYGWNYANIHLEVFR
jgi:hypothetical protein